MGFSAFRARLLLAEDFERFELILAMDDSTMQTLQMRCPPPCRDKLHYFTEFLATQDSLDILDPFYGDEWDFEQVLDQIEAGCDGLLQKMRQDLA